MFRSLNLVTGCTSKILLDELFFICESVMTTINESRASHVNPLKTQKLCVKKLGSLVKSFCKDIQLAHACGR